MNEQWDETVEYCPASDKGREKHRRILMLACSGRGYALMQQLKKNWETPERGAEVICRVKCSALPELSEEDSLEQIVGAYFDRVRAIIFFAAAGIAVRCIAPYIGHKSRDPAVIAVDDTGRYCIPLLSGHAGGANMLAREIAQSIGAEAVITTATDCENKFAVDEFARKNGLALTDWKLAKEISAAVLNGKQIWLASEYGISGRVPEALVVTDITDIRNGCFKPPGILISCRRQTDLRNGILQLVPRRIVAGIGCRRDTAFDKIKRAVTDCLEKNGLHDRAVCAVTSIDLKQNEVGILQFCEMLEVPFVTYSADELRCVEGNYSGSAFVEQITGTDCVCERSAALYAGGQESSLICGKTVYDGVTVALAVREPSISFD